MTLYFDIIGSDDFHSNVSNSDSVLSDNDTYLDNNAAETIGNASDEGHNVDYWPKHTEEIPLTKDTGDLRDRRDEADNWLQNNFDYYDSSSVCVVWDYYPSDDILGTSHPEGVNTPKKTAVINKAVNSSWTNYSHDYTSGHEIGHVCYANHEDVRLSKLDSYGYDWDATYLHTGEDVSGTCNDNSSYDDDVIEVKDEYSMCSYKRFSKKI